MGEHLEAFNEEAEDMLQDISEGLSDEDTIIEN